MSITSKLRIDSYNIQKSSEQLSTKTGCDRSDYATDISRAISFPSLPFPSLHVTTYYPTSRLELVVVDLVVGVLLQVVDEVLDVSALLVLDGVGLVVALEEVDGGEALDGHAGHVDLVGGGVHLGDDDVVLLLVLVAELVPSGGCVKIE
jgi:hypothetical protein